MSKQKHTEAELKLARMAMNDFLQIPCKDVVEFLDSERVEPTEPALIIFNKTIDVLIHNFKAKYLL